MHAELTRRFMQEEVAQYAVITGDNNPIHLGPNERFGRPIVHGMLYGSLFGTIFGASIAGSVYVSQSFKFRKPVFVGDDVTARVVVTGVREKPHLVTCATTILLADGTLATEGEAVVLLPQPTGGAAGSGAGGGGGATAAAAPHEQMR